MNKILKWAFQFVLRRKLGLRKANPGENIKWYESETIWAGVVITLAGVYELVSAVAPAYFGFELPPIPQSWKAVAGSALGGTVVWGRWTAEKKIG